MLPAITKNSKLQQQHVGPYKIMKVINPQIYGVAILKRRKINNTISLKHLEPHPVGADPFDRQRPQKDTPPPVSWEGVVAVEGQPLPKAILDEKKDDVEIRLSADTSRPYSLGCDGDIRVATISATCASDYAGLTAARTLQGAFVAAPQVISLYILHPRYVLLA